MRITTTDGRYPDDAIKDILRKVAYKLGTRGTKVAVESMANCIKRHFQMRYPGSKHYAPEKVNVEGDTVVVDVPGVTRAYHDMLIRPVHAQHLAIPLHRSAYGIKPTEAGDLFYTKNKAGTEMLAKVEGGALVVMYILKDEVHQKQDPTIMPSDSILVDAIKRNIGDMLK